MRQHLRPPLRTRRTGGSRPDPATSARLLQSGYMAETRPPYLPYRPAKSLTPPRRHHRHAAPRALDPGPAMATGADR
jgi:hypothetical protein